MRRHVLIGVLVLAAAVGAQAVLRAAPGAHEDVYSVEVKVIEAWRGATPTSAAALEPSLSSLEKDLRSLPFQKFKLVDGMQKSLRASEAFNLQFGKPQSRRFLRVTAMGRQDGKIRLDVAMEQVAGGKQKNEFQSKVNIPVGGTLVVVASRQPVGDNVILLAISARTGP